METYEEQILAGFEELSTSYPPAYPASRQAWPGSEEARRMTVGSGRQCSMWLDQSRPLGAFSRILLGSSHWGNSMEYCYVWERLDTKFELSAFQLTALGPSTDDNGCSLWRTPNDASGRGAMDGEKRLAAGHMLNLAEQVKTPKLWPTPSASQESGMDAQGRIATGHQVDLSSLARSPKLWPTPTAQEAKHGNPSPGETCRKNGTIISAIGKLWPTPRANSANTSQKSMRSREEGGTSAGIGLEQAAKLWPTPTVPNGGRRNPEGTSITGKKPDGGKAQIDLREFAIRMLPTPQAHDAAKGNPERVGRFGTEHGGRNLNDEMADSNSGSLNPHFVEQLMGYEIGHTDLKRSETPLSPSKRSRSSKRSRKSVFAL